MKRMINILMIISTPFFIMGQSAETTNPKFAVKMAPLSLIDAFGNTSCVFSLETRLKNNFSISVDAGFFYHSIGYGIEDNTGWRTGIELRHYLKNKEKQYLATSFTYKNQGYKFRETLIFPNDDQYEIDNIYTKQVSTFNLLYGIQKIELNKRFFINTFGGIGLRFKNIKSTGLTQEENDYRDYGDSQVLPLINETGKRLRPNLILGFKLGWVLI